MSLRPLLPPLAALTLAITLALPARAQILSGTHALSATEQTSFDLINRFRADPQGELARTLGVTQSTLDGAITPSTGPTAGNGTDWSTGFWGTLTGGNAVAQTLDFFQVSPGDLMYQWNQLPAAGTLHPYVWNGNLGQSALGYAGIVVGDAGATANVHAIAPYAPFGFQRYSDAGYTSATTVGENIAPNFSNGSAAYMHAGFAIDWGSDTTANGLQDGTGHRNSMLSASFTEAGIGIVPGWTSGRTTQVQHFGDRSNSAAEFIWGYAWQDAALGSYTFGEGLQGLTVQVLDASNNVLGFTTTDAHGGYMLDALNLADGTYTVRLMNGTTILGTNPVTISNLGLYHADFVTTPVPEPAAWLMLLAGGAPLLRRARRHARSPGAA